MPQQDNFTITIEKFYNGYGPAAHLNARTELGNGGHASEMQNANILDPTVLTQGPGLSDWPNGTNTLELINHILQRPTSDGVTFGIGPTRLFKIASAGVTSDGTWPHPITNCTDGESTIGFQGNLYYFFNKSSGGEIGKHDLVSSFDDDWGSTVPTGAAALQKAPHPSAQKEDILIFGNGRYVGTYLSSADTLKVDKLDFGAGAEVADLAFNANQWLLAVNSGVTNLDNSAYGQVYLYDGSATSTILSDEVAVGIQQIGFIYPKNGIVYLAYKDISGTCALGYISGREIVDLCRWQGALPNFAQKTLYKQLIIFASSNTQSSTNGLIYAAGKAAIGLPYALSQLMDGGFDTIGAVASPFGVPMIASTDGASQQRLATLTTTFTTNSFWRSLTVPTIKGRMTGYIDYVIVLTKSLAVGARADLQIEGNQGVDLVGTATAKNISGTGKQRHVFKNFQNPDGGLSDIRASVSWANGSQTVDCGIRKIIVIGHYKENT